MRNPFKPHLVVSLLLLSMLGASVFAQSTSTAIPIRGPGIDPATSPKITRGTGYLTITLVNSQVYQRTGILRRFIEINREAVVGFDIRGTIDAIPFSDTRVSPNMALPGFVNQTNVDMGWNVNIVESLPANFTGSELRIHLSKSARNGLSEVIAAGSEISASTPALTISPQVVAGLGAAKAISDFLFNRNLLQKKIEARIPLDVGGEGQKTGYFVVFAGDNVDSYARYINDAGNLSWNGGDMFHNTTAVDRISYFVIQIKSSPRFFPNSFDAPLSTNRNWANLYQQARGKIDGLVRPADANKTRDEIQTSLADARTVINSDRSLINVERDEIHATITSRINQELTQKIAAISRGE